MSEDFAANMAARIKELREARGLSVRALARLSGLPPESVSRSERGITEITVTSLAKVCRGLGIDLPTFFEFAGAAPTPAMRPDVQFVAEKLLLLPPDRVREISGALDTLLRVELAEAGARSSRAIWSSSTARQPASRSPRQKKTSTRE